MSLKNSNLNIYYNIYFIKTIHYFIIILLATQEVEPIV